MNAEHSKALRIDKFRKIQKNGNIPRRVFLDLAGRRRHTSKRARARRSGKGSSSVLGKQK